MKNVLLLLTLAVMLTVTTYANNFNKVIGFTFEHEGSKLDVSSNHSRYGVSRETIKRYNKKYKTKYTVKSLTKAQATTIAKTLYYDNYGIEFINNDKLAIAVFDFMYNSNPSKAAKCIEKAAQSFGIKCIKVNGVLTEAELKSLNSIDSNTLAKRICDYRLGYMKSLKVWKKYKKGWSKRVNNIKNL